MNKLFLAPILFISGLLSIVFAILDTKLSVPVFFTLINIGSVLYGISMIFLITILLNKCSKFYTFIIFISIYVSTFILLILLRDEALFTFLLASILLFNFFIFICIGSAIIVLSKVKKIRV